MRIVFINCINSFKNEASSHRFWAEEFLNQASDILFLTKHNWNINEIVNFKPQHIHFASDALPRSVWMPVNKIKKLRNKLNSAKLNTVITSYRGGVGKEGELLEVLNGLVDKAFGSTDFYSNQEWLPTASNPLFWNGVRRGGLCGIIYIGHASEEHIKIMRKRGIYFTKHKYLKALQGRTKLTVVGSGWKRFGIRHEIPTNTYEQNRNYYLNSTIGLNIVHDDLRKYTKYFSNRLIHMMQTGLPCITPYQPNLEKVFKYGEVIMYKNINDLLLKVIYYLDETNRDELRRIAAKGKHLVSTVWNPKNLVRKILSVERKQ